MRLDPDAPSRSYLKLEEALDRLDIEPHPGERVIDLGAAPGGWTYAFLKRGCHVLAVDNGPLNLTTTAPGTVQHQRADGISFAPPDEERPVDWMVCDMLVAPGKTLGLLRRWTRNRWLRRFICNMKLPQQNPYPALQPVEAWLAESPAVTASLRQLYHDRREVTIYGEVTEM
jgi:23S rRNA (cytidine2498-2'-O)-methyltransferase